MFAEAAASRSVGADVGADVTRPRRVAAARGVHHARVREHALLQRAVRSRGVAPPPRGVRRVVRGREPTRRSTITFTGSDPLVALEKFYDQSEQRIARFFQLGEEDFAAVIEHPDCDKAWLAALTIEQVKALETTETINLLETRLVRWFCGCNQARMLEVLAPVMRADPVELFGEHEKIEIRCPRCAARYTITREAMEAKVAEKK